MPTKVLVPDSGRFQPVLSPRDSISSGCSTSRAKCTSFALSSPRGVLRYNYEQRFSTPNVTRLAGIPGGEVSSPRMRKARSLAFTQATNPKSRIQSKNCTSIETFRQERDRAGMRTSNPWFLKFEPGSRERSHSATAHTYSQDCDWRPQRRSQIRVQSPNPLVHDENATDSRNFLDDMKGGPGKRQVQNTSPSRTSRHGPVRWTQSGDLGTMKNSPRHIPTFVQSGPKPKTSGMRLNLTNNHHLRKTTSFLEHDQPVPPKMRLSAREERNIHRFARICDHMTEYSSESQRLCKFFSARGRSSDVLPTRT